MLGLPSGTEIQIQVPKTRIFKSFDMKSAEQRRFDADISRIDIVNEVSPKTIAIAEGREAKGIYVMLVALKRADFNPKNIELIAKCFSVCIVFILEHDGKARLAVYRGRLFISAEAPTDALSLTLSGLDIDEIWHNAIIQIGGIEVADGNTLDEQIAIDERRDKIMAQVKSLEKKARGERQNRKQNDLFDEIRRLKRELNSGGASDGGTEEK